MSEWWQSTLSVLLVISGALCTGLTARALRQAPELARRAAKYERTIARIVTVAIAAAAVATNLLRNWGDGAAAMAGLIAGLGLALLAGAIALAIRLLRYRGDAVWLALWPDLVGFALMGIGAVMRYGAIALR